MGGLVLDKLGNRYLAYLYFSRVDFLAIALVSSGFWLVTGWDGTIEQVFTGGTYGTGIHWSTIQNLTVFFWILEVNMQVGGLNSLGDLWSAFKQDLNGIIHQLHFFKVRKQYLSYVVDPMRGVPFAYFIPIISLFIFENIWVLSYNYFQFGNWIWPIYNFNASFLNPSPFTFILFRNLALEVIIPLVCIPLVLYGPFVSSKYSFKWRFDNHWRWICVLTLWLWVVWISGVFPHATIPFSQLNIPEVIGAGVGKNFTLAGNWIYPVQQMFPQTTYTFYPAQFYLHGYPEKAIYGFHVQDDFIHLLNVVTKYMTFLTVCYPALVRVKTNSK